jgi:hypothetical protein
LANIPGRIILPGEEVAGTVLQVRHGWPATFLCRVLKYEDDRYYSLDTELALSEGRGRLAGVKPSVIWAMWREVAWVSFLRLAADIAAAAIVIAGGAALFEAWRRQRTRPVRFYLTGLLGLVTTTGVALCWLSLELRERREEQEAIKRIHAVCHLTHEETLAGPNWLRYLVGDRPFRVFDHVYRLHILTGYRRFCNFGPRWSGSLDNPEQLSHFRHLREINCGGSPATVLRFLPRPERLFSLTTLPSGDEGLLELRRFCNLQELDFLAPAPQFRQQADEAISDRGLAGLASLTKLRELSLYWWGADDKWLPFIAKLPHLEILVLGGEADARVTDAGLGNLSNMRSLTFLDLRGAHVTDAGLDHLEGLVNLKCLRFEHAALTAKGAMEFRRALPGCELAEGPSHEGGASGAGHP